MELEKAKKKRKTLRASVTRLTSKINEILKEDPRYVDQWLLKQCSLNLSEISEEIKAIDGKILDLLIEDDASDSECEKESEDAIGIKEKITYIQLSVEDFFKDHSLDEKLSRSESKASISSIASSAGSENECNRVKAKLPKLQLKKFSGKVSVWQEFWDSFKSAIHENKELEIQILKKLFGRTCKKCRRRFYPDGYRLQIRN